MDRLKERAAFSAFYKDWIADNPRANEYLPFEFEDFFIAGMETYRELVWHKGTETPEPGRSLISYNVITDGCETLYGGGTVNGCYWAYLDDLFNKAMLDFAKQRERDIEDWFVEQQAIQHQET